MDVDSFFISYFYVNTCIIALQTLEKVRRGTDAEKNYICSRVNRCICIR